MPGLEGLSMAQLRRVTAVAKRCKQLESALLARNTEIEDLSAKLHTADSTKDFLVTQLKRVATRRRRAAPGAPRAGCGAHARPSRPRSPLAQGRGARAVRHH